MFTSTFAGLTMLSMGCCWGPSHKTAPQYAPHYGHHVQGIVVYYVYPRVSPYNPVYHPRKGELLPVPPKDSPKTKVLYERLGGEAAIKAVVDDFVARAAANPKVNITRKGTANEWKATPENVAHLKKMLVELVGMVTGGPQKYTGKSMKDVHKGMKITQDEFNAAAGDLKATLDKFKVPAKEQAELLKIVGSTAPDIVEKSGK